MKRFCILFALSIWALSSLNSCVSSPKTAWDSRLPSAATASVAESQSAGVEIMKRQNKLYDSGIYATSSFADESALGAFSQSAGPDYVKAWNILHQEAVEVTLAAHEGLRDVIGNGGIKNTHETGTSGGTTNTDLRNGVEAAYVDSDLAGYKSLSNNIKPKYAYLAPKPKSLSAGLSQPKTIWNYGEDRYVLNLDKIRNRLSLTAGDSLNNMFGYLDPATNQIPKDRKQDIAHWHFRFTPWSKRTLLAPVLAQALSAPLSQGSGANLSQTFGNTLGTRIWYFADTEKNVADQGGFGGGACSTQALSDNHGNTSLKISYSLCSPFDQKVRGLEKYCENCVWSMDYIEAQIWGAITLDDIQTFVYTKTPPSPAFAKMLSDHHIEIRDGRR